MRVVRDVYFNYITLNILDLNFYLDFTRFQIVYNLRKKFLMRSTCIKYFSKKKGSSVSFFIFSLYDMCFQSLWDISVLPFVEVSLDKFTYGFRPFRNYLDFFSILKNRFKYNTGYSFEWFGSLNILPLVTNSVVLNNFPVEKRVLKGWIKHGLLKFDMKFLSDFLSEFVPLSNICFTLLNFIFSGIV